MERNHENLCCAEDNNKNSFKLFGATINVCKYQEKEHEDEICNNNCSSSNSEITTLKRYSSIDSMKSDISDGNDVVIISDDDEEEEEDDESVQFRTQNAIWKRKRGELWSEEEHRSFLAGLEKLGSGRWKRISDEFVPTRDPTQVVSHAQKYFMRASSANGGSIRRRASIFDSFQTSSLRAAGESSQAPNQISPSPEIGPIIHVPCRVVRRGGGKVRLVPLLKGMLNFARVNNPGSS